MKKFSLVNEEQLFIKKETTEGVLVYPGVNDMVLAVGAAATNQDQEFLDDAQIREQRSRRTPIKARVQPGSWSMTTYIKPSGSLGVAPENDVLWECLMGKKTINPGASVVYEFDSSTNLPSFSMLRKSGHVAFWMEGCTVNQAEVNVTGGEIASVAWSGQFMKWYVAGSDQAQSIVSASASTVVVKDATRFMGEDKIRISLGDDDNSGSGYLVTDINYATNTLTFSPVAAVGCAQYAVVRGFYPSPGVELGSPVHGKLGIVTIDTKPAVLLQAVLTIVNNIKYYADTKNNLMYPTVYGAPGFRDVSGTMRLFFYKNMPSYFYRSENQIQDALIVPAGNVAGKICELSCPQIEYKTPQISGDEEIMAELPFVAVGDAGDDELTVTFK